MPDETTLTADALAPVVHRAHGLLATAPHISLRDVNNADHVAEDIEHLKNGILDHVSFLSGFMPHATPVEVVVRNAEGKLKAIRRSHNLRTVLGGEQEVNMLTGGLNDASYAGGKFSATGTSTNVTSSTLTGSTTTSTTNEFQGHIIVTGGRYGVILSHTSGAGAVFTIDQWYDPAVFTGAAGSNPATGTYVILPGGAAAYWMALTNDATAVATDTPTTLTSEITANGLARARGTVAFTPVTAHATSTQTQTVTIAHTWTCATSAQACQQAALFNCAVPAGGSVSTAGQIMIFWATFTSASLQVGDTVTVTWTETL